MPAAADGPVPINPGNVPTTAKEFEDQDPQKRAANCKDIIDFLDSLPDEPETQGDEDLLIDGWHFILPGNTGDFEEIRLTFTKPDSTEVEVTVEGASLDPLWFGLFNKTGSGQVKHAYVFTEAGWTLTAGEADVTGTADKFNLSHTCAGLGDNPSTPPGGSGTPPPGGGSQPPGNGGTPGGGGGLPVTGAAVGGMVIVGVGMLAAGVALMAVRRRRAIEDLTGS